MFMLVVAMNTLQVQASTVSVSFVPSNPRPGEPVAITVTITNTLPKADTFHTSVYVNGQLMLSSMAVLQPGQSQSFSYTTGAPPLGQVIRAYATAWPQSTGVESSDYVLIPQSPPEAWMSFMAFSSFAISLASSTTTTLTSTFTLTYYANTMNLPTHNAAGISPVDVGLFLSVLLISLLVFIELTDKSYGKVGPTLTALRGRYGLLAANLLLVFFGIVATKVIFIVHG